MPKMLFLSFSRFSIIAALCLLLTACAAPDRTFEITAEAPIQLTNEALPPTQETAAEPSCSYAASLDGDAGSESISAQPDQTVQKTWTLRNDGSCDWRGVMLVLVAASDQSGIPVAETAAEVSVEVAVQLAAPAGTGVYGGEFRLR